MHSFLEHLLGLTDGLVLYFRPLQNINDESPTMANAKSGVLSEKKALQVTLCLKLSSKYPRRVLDVRIPVTSNEAVVTLHIIKTSGHLLTIACQWQPRVLSGAL